MKFSRNINYKKYIIGFIILIILYSLLLYKQFNKRAVTDRTTEVSENIRELRKSTKELTDIINKDKLDLDKFFFNIKTLEKIRGLIETYPSDRELSINDNLKIVLQQEGNPIKVKYNRAIFELVHNNEYVNGHKSTDIDVINDVKIVDNPNEIDEYKLIHELKTYLIDGYGSKAFDNFLDKVIADTIKNNNKLIENIS